MTKIPWPRRLRRLVYALLKGLAPVALWRYLGRRQGWPEPEMRWVPRLAFRGAAIDVGASGGQYALLLAASARTVLLFEPRAAAAAELRRRFLGGAWLRRLLRLGPEIRVEEVAVSEQSGKAQFRMLPSDPGRSTLEAENPIERRGEVETVEVPVRRLDDYLDAEPLASRAVRFIKIDVEGHEASVLRGARRLLERDRPSLLVEVEEQHHAGALAEVRALLDEFGYQGYFYWRGERLPLTEFKPDLHQNSETARERPVNNFLFLAPESEALPRVLLPQTEP